MRYILLITCAIINPLIVMKRIGNECITEKMYAEALEIRRCLAKNNPKNVPLAALFIAYLRTGAMVMSFKTNIQLDLTSVVEGVIVLFLLAERFLSSTYRKMIVAEAEKEKQNSLEQKEA